MVTLSYNSITDIAPLVNNHGVSKIDMLTLYVNPLNEKAYTEHIPELKKKIRLVFYDEQPNTIEEPNTTKVPAWAWVIIAASIGVGAFFILRRSRRKVR